MTILQRDDGRSYFYSREIGGKNERRNKVLLTSVAVRNRDGDVAVSEPLSVALFVLLLTRRGYFFKSHLKEPKFTTFFSLFYLL